MISEEEEWALRLENARLRALVDELQSAIHKHRGTERTVIRKDEPPKPKLPSMKKSTTDDGWTSIADDYEKMKKH